MHNYSLALSGVTSTTFTAIAGGFVTGLVNGDVLDDINK